jgi:hypothetical protein
MRYSIIFLCVEVVSYVLMVEVCLSRAPKHFQDGVDFVPRRLGACFVFRMAGCDHPISTIIPSIHVGHYSIIQSFSVPGMDPGGHIPPPQIVYIWPQSSELFTCNFGPDRDTSRDHTHIQGRPF